MDGLSLRHVLLLDVHLDLAQLPDTPEYLGLLSEPCSASLVSESLKAQSLNSPFTSLDLTLGILDFIPIYDFKQIFFSLQSVQWILNSCSKTCFGSGRCQIHPNT